MNNVYYKYRNIVFPCRVQIFRLIQHRKRHPANIHFSMMTALKLLKINNNEFESKIIDQMELQLT